MNYTNMFKSSLLTILLCVAIALTGCQEPAPSEDNPNDSATQNEELAHRYIEAYNDQDVESLAEILGDPIIMNGEVEDREAFLNIIQGYWNSFPDITLQPTHVVGAENYVTIRMKFSATGEGEWLGHDIDGREVHTTETILFGVEDDQLTEYWYDWGELTFWQQLGVLESPYPQE